MANLKSLKELLEMTEMDMLATEEETIQDDYMDYINQEVEAINNK